MAFIDQHLPEEIELNAVRREIEDLEIVTTDGGFEVRNAHQAQNHLEYELAYPPAEFSGEKIAAVKALFRASRGGLHFFPFHDWDDEFHTLDDEVIGIGDGAQTQFQVTKTWTVGGQSQSRKITRPANPLTVKKDGVTQTTGFSVSYTTGIVTFSPAPANGVVISVDGSFDVAVRFDPTMEATAITGWLEHIETLRLIEIKE